MKENHIRFPKETHFLAKTHEMGGAEYVKTDLSKGHSVSRSLNQSGSIQGWPQLLQNPCCPTHTRMQRMPSRPSQKQQSTPRTFTHTTLTPQQIAALNTHVSLGKPLTPKQIAAINDHVSSGKPTGLPPPAPGARWSLVDSGAEPNAANHARHFPGATLKAHAESQEGMLQQTVLPYRAAGHSLLTGQRQRGRSARQNSATQTSHFRSCQQGVSRRIIQCCYTIILVAPSSLHQPCSVITSRKRLACTGFK